MGDWLMTREEQLKCIEENCEAFKKTLLAKASKIRPELGLKKRGHC